MNKELGVWTYEDCALVLIDFQKEMFEVIRSETDADLVELNVRLLAKSAKAFDMPIVLSTVGVEFGLNGPTLPSILSELDGIEPIDRSSMNAFEDACLQCCREGDRAQASDHRRAAHRDLPHVRDRPGSQGRLRHDVRRPTRSAVAPRSPTAPGSRGCRTPAACRRQHSPSRRSCSVTGPRRPPARLSRSSTGTSGRSQS